MPLADALKPLASLKQFVVARIDPAPKPDAPWKTNKIPLNPSTLFEGNAQDPANWLDASAAYDLVGRLGPRFGVGFVLTTNDPVWCIDIDDALQQDGTWSPVAQQLCAAFPGAAIELSDSRHGLHIWGCGRAPQHGKKNTQWKLEFYTELRFILLGRDASASGSVATMHEAMLQHVTAAYFPPDPFDVGDATDEDWTDGPDPEWRGPTTDEELIRQARAQKPSAAMVFSGKATFTDLWTGDVAALARAFPSSTGDEYDRSGADSALALHLAYWTGRDCARIERLMRASALVRDKWDERGDYYMQRTVKRSRQLQSNVRQDRPPQEAPGPALAAGTTSDAMRPDALAGKTYLGREDQQALFTGMTLVLSPHGVLVPGGTIMPPKQFDTYLGRRTFVMDESNSGIKKSAWEAINQSQLIDVRKANGTTFRPDLAFGTLVHRDALAYVNTYWPLPIERRAGDATPFLNHLAKLLPNARDREIVLSYMAAIVQYPGVKFQWAPLIQGMPGNGKTTLSKCVAYAVGERYTHWPKASKLSGKFNGWMPGKVFYAVEDIHVANHISDEVFEELKPMITGEMLEIEGKGIDQVTTNICGNFLFNSNHKSGLRKTRMDRRIAPFYTPHQEPGDLERDGMTSAYFRQLRGWLANEGGFAIVADLLHTYQIPAEFDPTKEANRAPDTSSTEDAIEHGLGGIEQEVLNAIENERIGFCGGWVSSHFLDALLKELRADSKIPINRRRELMKKLDYDWHPALLATKGQVNNRISPDNAKPRLFVHRDSPQRALMTMTEAQRAYTAAQITSGLSVNPFLQPT